ncbi:MarR family winged helix-turn-helix transcriptional regulator [Limoniibacter endophyticus]|uniref:MarR family transcriptional regulator n=1 Tax=Limoniibacter endophyticus TaxID=1565040 RepID=A0A8J3GF83_9HYPH|nr:MarR family transcriptional regulator [Limoniibacter endophyticus]GHC65143.1 MarR family transcriptional regulator [Limoniibacter endophyticus]
MPRIVKSSIGDRVDAKALSSSIGAGNELSFALYGAANRMFRLHKPFLEPLGLTFPQYLVLLELFAGTPRTVGDLCAKLSMDTGTLTPLLKRLEASGKVTRTRDVADERRVFVDLTSEGEAIRQQVLAISGQIRSACKLDEQGVSDLRGTLDALAWPADRSGDH